MNVEELREIAEALVSDSEEMHVGALLTQLRDALTRQVSDPANAAFQTAVADARSALYEALRGGEVEEFSPRWRTLVDEMGIGHLLPGQMLGRIDELFLQNQVTPQVISDAVTQLTGEVEDALDQLRRLISALDFLRIESSALAPGEFEAAVLIPRHEVKNSLSELGREFQAIETLVRPFIEAVDGSPPPVRVRQIASSQFLAALCLAPGAALMLSTAIDQVLAVYERVLKIRKLRDDLRGSGLRQETVEQIEDDAAGLVEDEIPAIVRGLMQHVEVTDSGRSHEIEIAIDRSVRGIAKRVDHGFRLTVRAGPAPEPEESDGEAIEGNGESEGVMGLAAIREQVIENQKRADFQELAGEPILRQLGSGAAEDDDAREIGD